jgi:hypothetical protein
MTVDERVAVLLETLEQIIAKTVDPWARAIAEGAIALDAIAALDDERRSRR